MPDRFRAYASAGLVGVALLVAAAGASAQSCPNGVCSCPEGMVFIDGQCQPAQPRP